MLLPGTMTTAGKGSSSGRGAPVLRGVCSSPGSCFLESHDLKSQYCHQATQPPSTWPPHPRSHVAFVPCPARAQSDGPVVRDDLVFHFLLERGLMGSPTYVGSSDWTPI